MALLVILPILLHCILVHLLLLHILVEHVVQHIVAIEDGLVLVEILSN